MTDNIKITAAVKASGCGAKIGPADLSDFLCGFELPEDPDLLVGIKEPDDAGVYKLTDTIAIVQTIDFFTPIVDDPFIFGQIAAANSLSDIYAMGAKPLTAMNVFCFPTKKMPQTIAKQIIAGGLDIIKKANCLLVGGHSVIDDEIKYGLSVTGIVNPDKIMTKKAVADEDVIILTKPLGTGVISTAIKAGMADEESLRQAIKSMIMLNKTACEIACDFSVKACTDITGFGLAGHLNECLRFSNLGAEIYTKQIPFFDGVYELASFGLMPEGLYNNRDFYKPYVKKDEAADELLFNLLFDPQTSGGLLLFVKQEKSEKLLEELHSAGIKNAAIIGRVVKNSKNNIMIV